jgi:phospholipid transport system substrate-binding protein
VNWTIRNTLAALALAAVCMPNGALADGDTAPLATPVVEKLHAALLDIMKSADKLGYEGRYARLNPVVEETFDMPFMASKSVGSHWNELPKADQKRWLDVFEQHITANYAGQFTGYSGESFETLGEEPAIRDTRIVRTRLIRPSDDDVQLNYRLRQVDGHWRIIDIYLNGTVSELALRRSEYSSVLQREGFEKLISTIDEKVKELAAGSSKG